MRTQVPDPFVRVSDEDIPILIDVLKLRLPKSAHEYNAVLNKRRFRQDLLVYTLDGELADDAFVLLVVKRRDYGQDINLSAPLNYTPSEYLKQALISTQRINWDDAFQFTSIARELTPMIVEVGASVKKNSLQVNPNYQYVTDPAEVLKLDFSNLDEGIELRPLDKTSGAKFLVDNWKYSKDGTGDYVQNVVEKYPCAGVYVDGKLACGALVNVHGLIGLLYTDSRHRRMGLAQLCMRYLFREMAKAGMVPCSSAQAKNEKSCNFHVKLGMRISNETDYIYNILYTEGK